MKIWLSALLLLWMTHLALADVSSQASQRFGDYEVHYSILPSTFVPAEIAAATGIKRSKYESLINVSVTPVGEYGGLPVELSGTVTNLMQQQKHLEFKEIREQEVTYYLTPIRLTTEEQVHIVLTAKLADGEPMRLKFTTKLYPDNQ